MRVKSNKIRIMRKGMVIMKSKKMNEEEMKKRLHELSVEIVREAKSQYSKSRIKNLTIWPRAEGVEEDEEDIVYVNSELYNEYYGLLYNLEIALADPEEGDGIIIKYKPKQMLSLRLGDLFLSIFSFFFYFTQFFV